MPHLTRLISLAWDQSDPYRAAFFADPASRRRNSVEHRRIMKTVRRGDVEGLTKLLDAHRLGPAQSLNGLLQK